MRTERPVLVALAILLLSGCSGPAVAPDLQPQAPADRAWTTLDSTLKCSYFCEPSVAVDAGGLILARSEGRMALSADDGRTWSPRDPPPVSQAAPPGAFQNDGLVQAGPDGRFYFSALITVYNAELQAILLDGLQVASSGDAGETWDADVYLSVATTPRSPGLGADRQWLTFGAPGEVYLSYQQVPALLVYHPVLSPAAFLLPSPPGDLMVAASADGGRTFSEFRNAVPPDQEGETQIIGAGAVSGGRLFVPYLRFGARDEAAVAVSDNGGASFRAVPVGPPGDFFPRLAAAADGTLHMAWKTVEDDVVVASSADGGEIWTPATAWSAGNATSSPWMSVDAEGALDVVWLEALGGGSYRLMYRHGAAQAPGDATELARLEAPDTVRAYTDYVHFDRLPDGRIAVIHGDIGTGKAFLIVG